MKKIFFLFSLIFVHCLQAQQNISIIPKPVSLVVKPGSFLIDSQTNLKYSKNDSSTVQVVNFFADYINNITGISLSKNINKSKNIQFILEKIPEIGEEGYLLEVTPNTVIVKANTSKGFFYAVQSLIQTLPAIRTNDIANIPCMEVKDYPRFTWRGFMLDVSRHFFSPDMIKEIIDILASYKINTFHWHLVDGAGWRIEIKKYPKLTQQAAWRVDDTQKPWNWSELEFNADRNQSTYGGFYTQEQLKDIVEYAEKRNISIIPEIEMPGHSEIVMATYPELSCTPETKYSFKSTGNLKLCKAQSNFCAGNDQAFKFLEDVLNEVMMIFPSKYIHIGGDEVDKSSWKNCSKCQHRIKNEHLKNEEELQSYFIRRIEKFLISKNRKLIGWDEILEGGLAPEATVMSWRSEAGGIQAAKMKHHVIMTPQKPCYFDHYQGDPETEPLAIGGFNTLKKIYQYEPIPAELNPEDTQYILGAQANLWTEYISTNEHLEYMILPRLLALSEVIWSDKKDRNWEDFYHRLQPHLTSFNQKGFHYSKGNFKVAITPTSTHKAISVALETENKNTDIYYTLDGSIPTKESFKFDKPFEINTSTTVNAVMASNGTIMNKKPTSQSFTFNKATGKNVIYEKPFNAYYPANGANTLTDGFRGTKEIASQWHAFNSEDMIATIDLGTSTSISKIILGSMQNWNQWIFYPKWIKFEISQDGINFKEVHKIENTVAPTEKEQQYKDFTAKLISPQDTRYVKVTAKNLGLCPDGSPGEKHPAWLFIDEIIVE